MREFDKKLSSDTYLKDIFSLCREDLLGAYLCSNIGGKFTAGMITEVEAYVGSCDKACHAYLNKLTKRTATMFRCGGCAYVYFVYGMYNQFNVVQGPEGTANAVLVRSLQPLEGLEVMQQRRQTDKINNLTTGPGKLCQALGITAKEHNGINLDGNTLWISPKTDNFSIIEKTRIGIDYAEEYRDKLWRFYIKGNSFVSKH